MSITKDLCNLAKFNEISNILLNKSVLCVGERKFRICEIEMYYRDKDHDDQYVHGDNDQLDFGIFYFHKYKNGSYKSGTYKGMDITLGNNGTYFGILIRSIMDVKTHELIEGPCKSVNAMLAEFKCHDVKEFMSNKPKKLSIFDKKYGLYIEQTNDLKSEEIMCGPRVGLSAKYPDFLNKDYRYAIFSNKIKKQKTWKLLT